MPDILPLTFLPLLNGTLTVGHRPKIKTLPELKQRGITHVVTLLSEKEGALDIKKAVEANDLQWLWLPLANAEPPLEEATTAIKATFTHWQHLLDEGASLYLHCSAGIHRTGMIAYALLRYLDHNVIDAMQLLKQLRSVTAEGVGLHRLRWGDQFSNTYQNMKTSGSLTLEELLHHNLIGKLCYAHSTGGGYQYRGKIVDVAKDGSIEMENVETVSNEDYDEDFTNPFAIPGPWEEYEDIGYRSPDMYIDIYSKGITIHYSHMGTVYIHFQDYENAKVR